MSAQRWQALRRILSTLTVVLFLFLLLHLCVQQFHIQGSSMEPTLHNQEYMLVNKAAYLFQAPARGDVIVFQYPLDPQVDYVKRIIAIPGDVISVINQSVIVNGVTLRESYVNKDNPFNPYPSFRNHIVGPDEYFVMGDNRVDSSDSRKWGLVPRNNIIGQAIVIYWPLDADNLGFLPSEHSIFAQITQ
jgi:signal peptidase I